MAARLARPPPETAGEEGRRLLRRAASAATGASSPDAAACSDGDIGELSSASSSVVGVAASDDPLAGASANEGHVALDMHDSADAAAPVGTGSRRFGSPPAPCSGSRGGGGGADSDAPPPAPPLLPPARSSSSRLTVFAADDDMLLRRVLKMTLGLAKVRDAELFPDGEALYDAVKARDASGGAARLPGLILLVRALAGFCWWGWGRGVLPS